jgi:hypothetical protein
MSIYKKLEAQARKFEKSYPQDLPDRLEWWCNNLGVDRVRLLRVIGLSARQAERRKHDDLKETLKNPEWADNALGLEGKLHWLLSLYNYDWHALAESIRRSTVETQTEEFVGAGHRRRESKRLPSTANGAQADRLIKRLSEGGRESVPALVAYLIESRDEAERPHS